MAWKRSVLVVANKTASSDGLRQELRSRAASAPTVFTLLLVAGRGQDADQLLGARLSELREDGLEVPASAVQCGPTTWLDLTAMADGTYSLTVTVTG